MKKLLNRIFKDKEMREYMKIYKKHRKAMIKLAKEDRDWDYGFLHTLVVTKIEHMYEYYSAGNNVWQSAESLNKVLETLEYALDLANEIESRQGSEVEALYKEFYSYIGDNIMWWWD